MHPSVFHYSSSSLQLWTSGNLYKDIALTFYKLHHMETIVTLILWYLNIHFVVFPISCDICTDTEFRNRLNLGSSPLFARLPTSSIHLGVLVHYCTWAMRCIWNFVKLCGPNFLLCLYNFIFTHVCYKFQSKNSSIEYEVHLMNVFTSYRLCYNAILEIIKKYIGQRNVISEQDIMNM